MNSEMLFRPTLKVSVVESIVNQVVDQIGQGTIVPGERLPSERRLMELFSVGRSSVREALQGLAAMGLVESRPGLGTFVSKARAQALPHLAGAALSDQLQREMRLQLVEAERTLEPAVARLAALRCLAEDIPLLYEHLADYVREPFAMPPDASSFNAHGELHLALARMTGNPFYVPAVESLLRAIPAALRRREATGLPVPETVKVTADAIAMHTAIVQAVVQKDGDAAYKAMDDHLDYERRLVEQMYPE